MIKKKNIQTLEICFWVASERLSSELLQEEPRLPSASLQSFAVIWQETDGGNKDRNGIDCPNNLPDTHNTSWGRPTGRKSGL